VAIESRKVETVIDRPADEVWARIRDFGEVSWIPNTESVQVEGDVRTVTMTGGKFKVSQRETAHDDANRSYSYEMAEPIDMSALFGKPTVLEHLEATLSVTPKGEGSSVASYALETHDFMIGGVEAEYQGALDNLKVLLEG
jgi:carbon monoxide dehydrogenase subunit G